MRYWNVAVDLRAVRTGVTETRLMHSVEYLAFGGPLDQESLQIDDGYNVRFIPVRQPELRADRFEAEISGTGGSRVLVRPIRESDGPLASIAVRTAPMPVPLIEAALNGEITTMPEIYALVDDEGDVFTLIMFGTDAPYVRVDQGWLPVPNTAEVIENYQLLGVADAAVDLYDAADIQGLQVSALALPLAPEETYLGVGNR
jgi:hypothetical protein